MLEISTESDAIKYMLIGDLDKPFHLCECECGRCEGWRQANKRPTHAELRAKFKMKGGADGA